jgi:Mn-dependent DtxR family transcriptional regulator|tara:strand:+ start:445 stop:624 length:180 start_codon:yes stop_codon:yes gene_type:complete
MEHLKQAIRDHAELDQQIRLMQLERDGVAQVVKHQLIKNGMTDCLKVDWTRTREMVSRN